ALPPQAGAGPRRRAEVADDSPLMAALRQWRREEAGRRELPAYIIFHDKTLAAIAEARPQNKVALGRIAGIGPAKIAAYGDAVLAVVATGAK
ncbi:MAG: HRDC domain-containing protein, partial [Actinomycetota bacterium]